MKVLSPNDTNHQITFIPRFNIIDGNDVEMELYNEETSITTTYTITSVVSDGYVYLDFTETFINNSNFQIKIIRSDDILYRGKLFITDQTSNLQQYEITKDVFTL